jgi:hypothetical protein
MSMAASPLAKRIVRRIVDDFTGRSGMRQVWDQIDDDVKGQIQAAWVAIVDDELIEGGQ